MSNSNVVALRSDGYAEWLSDQVPAAFSGDRVGADPAGVYSYPPCRIHDCPRFSASPGLALCKVHVRDWDADGDESVDEAVARMSALPQRTRKGSVAYFDLGSLPSEIIRNELAYGLAERGVEANGYGPIRPEPFNRLVRALAAIKPASLLSLTDTQRSEIQDICDRYWASCRPILDQTIASLRIARGDTDVKRPLGARRGGSTRFSRHQEIVQPWFRKLVARYVDYRLNTEAASPQHVGQQEAMIVAFAGWCATQAVASPADFTRPLLIAWLGHVRQMTHAQTGKPLAASYRRKIVGSIEQFIAIARVEFDQRIPVNARLLRGDPPALIRQR